MINNAFRFRFNGIILMIFDHVDRKALRSKYRFAACGGGQCDALGFSVVGDMLRLQRHIFVLYRVRYRLAVD